jgi:hypothetical protein
MNSYTYISVIKQNERILGVCGRDDGDAHRCNPSVPNCSRCFEMVGTAVDFFF